MLKDNFISLNDSFHLHLRIASDAFNDSFYLHLRIISITLKDGFNDIKR
jgi:hypothetical protein